MRTEAGRGESQPPTTGSQESGRGQSPPGPPGSHPPSQLLGLEFWPLGYERTHCPCRWPPGAAPAHSHWAPLGHAAPGERELRASERQLAPAGFRPTPLPTGPPEGPAQSPPGKDEGLQEAPRLCNKETRYLQGGPWVQENQWVLGVRWVPGDRAGPAEHRSHFPAVWVPSRPHRCLPVLLVL